jgi:hypothetical protein
VTAGTASSRPSPLAPSLGAAVGTFVVAAGWAVGLRPLADNSFFTHLATGRIILGSGHVPSVDPYTFTAHGHRWLVQSWLASVLYASVESVAGIVGVRLLMGVIAAGLTMLAWRLTRPAVSVLPRLAIGVVFVAASAELWSERPLMLGLVAFACVVLAAQGELDPRWLVPIGWVWVNVHGSFPLGIVYLIVVAAGQRLDGRSAAVELRALRWLALGVVLGAVGPLGPAVLTFPIELLQRQDEQRNVIEWRAPTFESFSQRVFLVQLALVVLALVRRPSYRSGLVVAVFTLAALLGSRNLTVASLLFLPILAASAPEWGSLRGDARTSLSRMIGVLGVAVLGLLGVARLDQRDVELRGYPIDALAYLDEQGIDLTQHHMATKDVVGNLLELVYGPGRIVFYDDRFDMFPDEVSAAHLALVQGSPRLRSALDELDIELVTVERSGAVAQRLVVDPAWRPLYSDERWVVTCRRGVELGGRVGRC